MCDLHGHNFYPNPRLFRLAGEGSKYAVPNSHVLNRNQPSLFSRGRGVVMFKLRGEGKMCNLHVLPNDLIFNPNQHRFPVWGGNFQGEGEGISNLHVLPIIRMFALTNLGFKQT